MTPGVTRTGHAQGVPVHTILTTPPVRPEPRRRGRGWAALLLVPLMLIGLANAQDGGSMTDGCPPYGDAGPGVSDCVSYGGTGDGSGGGPGDSALGFWTEDVTGTAEPLGPPVKGSPKVSRVPADVSVLRVEVVSTMDSVVSRGDSPASTLETQIDTSAGGAPIDAWDQGTPHALDVHLGDRTGGLQVTVNVTSGSGTVQCRVYAGSTLVAIDTSTTTAMCTPSL